MHIDNSLGKMDRILIYIHALPKAIQGILRGFLFSEREGIQFIGRRVSITRSNRIVCGKNVKFEDYAEIHGLARQGLHFGNNVTIGRGTMIRPSSYYGGDFGEGLAIGDDSSIGPHGYVGCAGKIQIGSNVMCGPKCSFFAENHVFKNLSIPIKEQGVIHRGIVIEDNCWLGSNVIVLDGVTIGEGSVIGAGTIITKSIKPGSKVYDSRSKVIVARKN